MVLETEIIKQHWRQHKMCFIIQKTMTGKTAINEVMIYVSTNLPEFGNRNIISET